MLLAMDTATTTASLAVYDLENDRLLAEMTWEARRRQTQDLLVTAESLLARLNLSAAAIDALAVTTGPGSFTGVRIGISTAKGIALGLAARPRVVGIPTLNVTAAPWLDAVHSANAEICACIQAGRGRYNWALFDGRERLKRLDAGEHHAGKADDLVKCLGSMDGSIWLVGELAADVVDAMAAQEPAMAHVRVIDNVSGLRRAGSLARLAAAYFAAGIKDDLSELQPLYLRNP